MARPGDRGHEEKRTLDGQPVAPRRGRVPAPEDVEAEPGEERPREAREEERLHRVAQDAEGRKDGDHPRVEGCVAPERDEGGRHPEEQEEPLRPRRAAHEGRPHEAEARDTEVVRLEERLADLTVETGVTAGDEWPPHAREHEVTERGRVHRPHGPDLERQRAARGAGHDVDGGHPEGRGQAEGDEGGRHAGPEDTPVRVAPAGAPGDVAGGHEAEERHRGHGENVGGAGEDLAGRGRAPGDDVLRPPRGEGALRGEEDPRHPARAGEVVGQVHRGLERTAGDPEGGGRERSPRGEAEPPAQEVEPQARGPEMHDDEHGVVGPGSQGEVQRARRVEHLRSGIGEERLAER